MMMIYIRSKDSSRQYQQEWADEKEEEEEEGEEGEEEEEEEDCQLAAWM